MRLTWLFLLALGCHKDAAPASTGSAGATQVPPPAKLAADAAIDSAAAPAPLVDLLRAVPATVRLSSRVANPAIKPEHIVDHDLQTAWNSATGELVGAWIEVTIPGEAQFAEIRMTVGHTGKGPKGEDYFTMNPRIKKVTIARSDGRELVTIPLDPDNRALQTIAVATPGGTLRITVDEILAGSKKTWRETAVSELEVWGTPPPGWKAPTTPLVPRIAVGDPDLGTEESLDGLCAALLVEPLKGYAAYAANATGPDGDEAPTCDVSSSTLKTPKPPWTGLGMTCFVPAHNLIDGHGIPECALALATDGRWWNGPSLPAPPRPEDAPRDYGVDYTIFESYVVTLPDPMLVVRYRIAAPDSRASDYFTVCRAQPKRGCSEPIASGGVEWKTRPTQDGADLVMVKEAGTPPDDELGIVTAQLKFP